VRSSGWTGSSCSPSPWSPGDPLWAIVDALSRPSGAFKAAGSSKGMWVALILVFWLLTGLIGVVLAVVYLAAIRPRVRAVTPGF